MTNNTITINENLSNINNIDLTPSIEIKKQEKNFDEIKIDIEEKIKKISNNRLNFINHDIKFEKKYSFIGNIILSVGVILFFSCFFFLKYLFHENNFANNYTSFIIIAGLLFFSFIYFNNNKDTKKYTKTLYKLSTSKEKIENFIKKEDYSYFLPLSSKEIAIICYNNDMLKEHLINNNYDYISMQLIDDISGKSINNNLPQYTYKDSNNYGEKIAYIIYSEIEKDNVFKIIKKEQEKFKKIDTIDIINFKVTYKIKNGPTKNITFKHSHEDHNVFKNYIENVVENNYGRGFDIIKINKV